jgi:hypothetical protein
MSIHFFGPSRALSSFFESRGIKISHVRCQELLCCAGGLAHTGQVHSPLAFGGLDGMFEADAIILDWPMVAHRMPKFGIADPETIRDDFMRVIREYWSQKLNHCPSFCWSLQEAFLGKHIRIPTPSNMFTHGGQMMAKPILENWLLVVDPLSLQDMSSGLISPTDAKMNELMLPVKLRILDKTSDDLPPEHRHQFPVNGVPGILNLQIHGTRGVSVIGVDVNDAAFPNELSDTAVPWQVLLGVGSAMEVLNEVAQGVESHPTRIGDACRAIEMYEQMTIPDAPSYYGGLRPQMPLPEWQKHYQRYLDGRAPAERSVVEARYVLGLLSRMPSRMVVDALDVDLAYFSRLASDLRSSLDNRSSV